MKSKKAIRPVHALEALEALEARIAPALFFWNTNVSGNWSDASKWYNNDVGAANNGVPDDLNDIATFDSGSGSPTVTLDNNFTIQQLNFMAGTSPQIVPQIFGSPLSLNFERVGSAAVISLTGSGSPVISAKVVAFAGFGVNINVAAGNTLVFNGPLSESSGYFNKIGDGTATFGGAAQNTFSESHGLQVTAGTLNLSKDAGATPMSGKINIVGGALVVTQDPTLGNEEIDNNSTVTVSSPGVFRLASRLGEVVGGVTGNGAIDLQGNRLSVLNTSTFTGTFASNGTIASQPGGLFQLASITQGAATELNVSGSVRLVAANVPGTNFTILGPNTVFDGSGVTGTISGGAAGIADISPGTGGAATSSISVGGLTAGASDLDVGFAVAGTTPGTGHDQIIVRAGGAINLTGGTLFTTFPGFTPTIGQTFKLIDNQNPVAGPITGVLTLDGGGLLPEGATVATFNGGATLVKISYAGGDGNDLVFNAVSNVITVGAPAFSADGKTATYTDVDGDTVTVKTDKGAFSAANFSMTNIVGASGAVLKTLDLSRANFGKQYKGATIKVKVTQGVGGDGFVNVGRIDATGIDLALVKVAGELEQIDVGDANLSTPGLGALKAISMGVNALNPVFGFQSDPAGALTSSIVGPLGALQVGKGTTAFTGQSGIVRAFIDVSAGATEKLGTIGSIAIDQLLGLDDAPSVLDGTGVVTFTSGTIRTSGKIGSAVVNGGVTGAAGDYSGDLWSRRGIGSVTINGNVTGAAGVDSGSVFVGSPDGGSNALGKPIDSVKITGSLTGGTGEFSGTVFAGRGLGKVRIGGSVLGGGAGTTGAIVTLGGIGSVKIAGTLTGGGFQYAGSIVAFGGDVGAVTVTQALATTGSGFGLNGIFVNGNLGTLTTGALNSASTGSGAIVALTTIGTVTVSGNATNWNIAAGFDTEFAQDANGSSTDAASYNPDATIAAVTIGGTLTGGSITAGTLFGADFLPGGADDLHMPGDTTPSVLSGIASIVVAGQAANAFIEAQQISAVRIAGIPAPLTAGTDTLTVGTSTTVREL